MTLSARAKERLDRLYQGKFYGVRDHDYHNTIDLLVDLFKEGEGPHVKDIRHWARYRGWPDEHVDEIGQMVDVIYIALRRAGVVEAGSINS